MASNATYVFIDLGTTNDPRDKNIKHITELSMAAISKEHLMESSEFYGFLNESLDGPQITPHVPRAQLKLTLCFNPGLNELPNGGFHIADLKLQKTFDECFELIDNFLNILTEPVYLIAHNGFNFDFPILKRHLKGKKFSKDILCADTFYGFYDILENRYGAPKYKQTEHKGELEPPPMENKIIQFANLSLEDSLESKKMLDDISQSNADRVKTSKGFPWGKKENRPTNSYKLTAVYERVLKCIPEDAHKGDIDCQLMIRIAVKLAKEFVEWVENNNSSFDRHVEVASEEKVNLEGSPANVEAETSGNSES